MRTKKMIKKASKIMLTLMLSLTIFLAISYFTLALPSAPTLTPISNSTSASAGVGTLVNSDDGGYIYTITLNALQQNLKWKAYVGNVTGKLVLEDSDAFSIYEWDMSLNTEGKVFVSRNDTIQWATVGCSNETNIENEDAFFGMSSTSSDSINQTFNYTAHKAFNVAGRPITNSTCRSLATYVNDTKQTVNESAKFQEVLLSDSDGSLIYTSLMEQDELGYNNESSYDFQLIIADDETNSVITPYYFYVELGI